jgi:4-hydroxy-3-methylbut-2-enyl diphosphate reductase
MPELTAKRPKRPSRMAPASAAAGPASLLVLLAAPRGFCAGVRRAISAVTDALDRHGPPVYVRRAIVHNMMVVRELEQLGAVFVQELNEVPDGAVVVLSAHGVPRSVIAEAERRGLLYSNATCPLVAKVHREVVRHHREGRHVVLVGHAGHPEVSGTLGQLPPGAISVVASPDEVLSLELKEDAPLAYAVQTTYSMDEAAEVIAALEGRFADLVGPAASDICYATTNRQTAVKEIAPRVDAMIVAGEHFSSNASRLAEVALAFGCPSVQLVPDASHVDWSLLARSRVLGITAAASTPDGAVDGIIAALRDRFDISLEEVGHLRETVAFRPVKIA